MYNIVLEIAENGVIKNIDDNNADGCKAKLVERKIYDFKTQIDIEEFLTDICYDIGLPAIGIKEVVDKINEKQIPKKISLWNKITKQIKRFFS